ncbi:hypothetical protein BH09ACT3_BH09ACT3_11060 [soil metagenome]
MRLVAAVISFVFAFAMIAFGIAQRTILAPPDNVTASIVVPGENPITLIESETLRSVPGRQNVEISGDGAVFAAYGRTEDVMAWVGDASYNTIGYNVESGRLTSTETAGDEAAVPNPQGSDLWLDEYARAGTLGFTVNVPEGITVIIASDGTAPAPAEIAIRWPIDNRTPWAGPLIVGGGLLALLGVALYFWALAHLRRLRGPQRKAPKMPKPPKPKAYKPGKSSAPRPGRRSAGRRAAVAVPIIVIGALGLSGCSGDYWPEFMGGSSSGSSTPAPIASGPAAVADDLPAPAVTVPQLKVIVARISALAAKTDADRDTETVKTRFTGAALQARLANYGIRRADNTQSAPAPIPAGDVELTLPQQSDTWPRTVFTVVQNPADTTIAPVALMLVQETARSNYKVAYAVALEAKAVLPDVAPASVGAVALSANQKLLKIVPANLALAYGDLLEKGTSSEFAPDFDLEADSLYPVIGPEARAKLVAAVTRATVTFVNANGEEPLALVSNDSGAIVAVQLVETHEVRPSEAGASVNPEGQVKSLSGVTGSTKGTAAVYGDQLLFYVPQASSREKIRLLGFASSLIAAREL